MNELALKDLVRQLRVAADALERGEPVQRVTIETSYKPALVGGKLVRSFPRVVVDLQFGAHAQLVRVTRT